MIGTRHCPALLIAAPASGQGKTTVTAAIARHHRRQGRCVRVFKSGPDFLDPMVLEVASGAPVGTLDLWLVGEAGCRAQLFEAAGDADLILVEGVMGLFDGKPSSADLAECLGIPVLGLIDASAMAQTFGAVAHGLATLRPELPFAGVLANRIGSERHAAMLSELLPDTIPMLGHLPRAPDAALPSRHLGLVQAGELDDLETRLDHAAGQLVWSAVPIPEVAFEAPDASVPEPLLAGTRIALARDAAFAFIYPANVALLKAMGAEVLPFSPLAGDPLPDCDAAWLPGGYPELHLTALSSNDALRADLSAHVAAGKPLLAECGGMLALLEALADADGNAAPMWGLLEGSARLQKRFAGLGPQQVVLPEGALRGHTYHHARMDTGTDPLVHATCPNGGPNAEAVYRRQRMTATFVHFYFPSNPVAAAKLFLP
ncbi:cobyrinate a,c-diamide synthase [Algiphilus sp.]|uniref:cobyrinate a,c-diamide synthase n=1 Tax=Algiphilus sp. TaxID=1872431 RepID=UPI0025BD98E4|nr:cobyrinate a,c-diamide synthase [Algiphilus sp.]